MENIIFSVLIIVITYNSRLLFESQEDFQKIFDILRLHQYVVNFSSEKHFGASKNSLVELHRKVYHPLRQLNPEIPSCVITRGIAECLSNYRSIKSNKHKITSPVKKTSLSMRLDRNLYKIKGDNIKLTSVGNRISAKVYLYPKLEELLKTYVPCDPLIYLKEGEIWIGLTFRVTVKPCEQKLAIGIDVGCKKFLVTSEGNALKDKKFNNDKRKLRYLKRRLQSKNTKSAKRHLRILRRKEHNKNKEFCNLSANWLLKSTKADVLVFEDLSKIKEKKHKYQNKNRVSQIPWFDFKRIVTYKAHALGKEVKTVSAMYTSQIDYSTGQKSGERCGCRYYSSKGVVWDADWNAAINIANRSKLPVSWRKPVDGQAVVTQPIVYKSNRCEATTV